MNAQEILQSIISFLTTGEHTIQFAAEHVPAVTAIIEDIKKLISDFTGGTLNIFTLIATLLPDGNKTWVDIQALVAAINSAPKS